MYTKEEFTIIVDKIVQAGASPVVICDCGYRYWMHGSADASNYPLIYNIYYEHCRRCKQPCKKNVYGDFQNP